MFQFTEKFCWQRITSFSPQVQGRNVPRPVTAFDEVNFPEYMMSAIRAQGFASPTAIQCQSWPMALSGRDVVAIAQTGSGKTISFALPAMLHIKAYVSDLFRAYTHAHAESLTGNLLSLQVTALSPWFSLPPVNWLSKFNKNAQNSGMALLDTSPRNTLLMRSLDRTLVSGTLLSMAVHQKDLRSEIYSAVSRS